MKKQKYKQDGYNEKGQEIHNGAPVRMPIGFHRPSPLADTINRLVDRRLAEGGASEADETFEEAQNFDCGTEPEDRMPAGGWELGDDQSDTTMTPEVPKVVNTPPEDGVRNTSAKDKVPEVPKTQESNPEPKAKADEKPST